MILKKKSSILTCSGIKKLVIVLSICPMLARASIAIQAARPKERERGRENMGLSWGRVGGTVCVSVRVCG